MDFTDTRDTLIPNTVNDFHLDVSPDTKSDSDSDALINN